MRASIYQTTTMVSLLFFLAFQPGEGFRDMPVEGGVGAAKERERRISEIPIRMILEGDQEDEWFDSPDFIEVDREGNLYIVDSHRGKLGKWSPDGRMFWQIDGSEWGGSGFLHPRSVGVSSGPDLYLLDVGKREVYRINDRGEILGVIANTDLKDPRAIRLTSTGKLVVYDASTAEVSVLAASGGVLWSFRPEGFRARSRVGLTIRDEEELCLFSRGTGVLRMYHFLGGLKKVWRPTLPDGRKLTISSVDFDDSGRVYLLDGEIPGLFVFDGLGNLLLDLRGPLKRLGFKGPGHIRTRGSTVYVAEIRRGKIFELEIPPGLL